MDKLEVGRIINTHGLRGEVKVTAYTDTPDVFEKLKYAYIKDEKYKITSVKYQKNNLIVKLSGIDDIDTAEALKNVIMYADRSQLGELPPGVYYIVDIIGCEVFDEENNSLGHVVDVFSAGGGNVYDIKKEGRKNILMPASEGVVLETDIENKKIKVRLPEGILDLN